MLSACSYVYADKFTACVQNVHLPNARMLSVAHATGQWMHRWRLVQCCSKRSADTVAVRQNFECLVDALLHCSPDFVIHRVKIWTVRWPMFRWNKIRRIFLRNSSLSRARGLYMVGQKIENFYFFPRNFENLRPYISATVKNRGI